MLVELAIGDSYGVIFEMADRDFVDKYNNLKFNSYQPSLIKEGHYTDDTQMTIAICEALVDRIEWTPLNIARKFIECFKRDERRGYSGHFYLFLKRIKTAEEFLKKIQNDSKKCGAAMRATPLGLFKDIDEIKYKCDVQSSITHNTDEAKGAAFASALMTHYFRYGLGERGDLGKWLAEKCGNKMFEELWAGERVTTLGWHCVHAAASAIQLHDKMSNILKQSIAYTGDTDTIATIAMAAASWGDIEQDLPQELVDNLENGQYGKDFLIDLEKKLCLTFD